MTDSPAGGNGRRFSSAISSPPRLWDASLGERSTRPNDFRVDAGAVRLQISVDQRNPTLLAARLIVGHELADGSRKLAAPRRGGPAEEHPLYQLTRVGSLFAALVGKPMAKLFRRDTPYPMRHVTENHVKHTVGLYLVGRISWDSLEVWLARATWDEPGVPDIAYRVQLLMAEADRGHRPNVSDDLRALMTEPWIAAGGLEPPTSGLRQD